MSRPRRNDVLIPLITVVSDILAIEAAFLCSYWLRFFSPMTQYFEVELGIPPLSSYVTSSLVFIPLWVFVFNSRALYGTRRNTHLSDELFALIRVITICMLIMMSATFFYREFSYSRGVFILLYFTSIAFVATGRFLVMEFEKFLYRQGKELKSIVIIGTGAIAEKIFQQFTHHKELGYEVLGCYAENPPSESSPLQHTAYLGPISSLQGDIVPKRIQAAIIALKHNEQNQLLTLLRDTEGMNIEFMMVPDMVELMTSRIRIQEIEGIPFITLKDIPMSTWNRILKRMFDLIVSLGGILIISPLLALIALLIKVTSKGPVLYSQERIGLDGRSFMLYKFRSMTTDAEKASGPLRAKKGDQRVTAIGKILRRTSLDELPQLFNVLTGEMSLVGPRPERPFFVDQFKEKIPRYLERHRVKTGMTGWAQVNGLRGDVPIEDRTRYDIYYVENWSLIFDLKIILKTIRAVIFGEDAY